MANENLGPAERIIQTLLTYQDHLVHNRPGVVTPDPTSVVGVKWDFGKPRTEGVTGKDDPNKHRVVYTLAKVGKKTVRQRVGVLQADGKTIHNGGKVGEYRKPGFFPEVCAYAYRQIAEVWRLDNEFAARWASYAFAQEHRDMKVVLAAFMLVQSRAGEPITENGKLAFHDEDFREVGEAMLLISGKGKHDFNPRLIHRVREFLALPEVTKINHDLGFGKSARRPELGRWTKAVTRWLHYRETNPKLLDGLVKAGFRQEVISLACQTRYVPQTPAFYKALRWKQEQGKEGQRKLALDQKVTPAETWEGLTEEQVCERIVKGKPKWNRLSTMLPKGMGLTRAIMACAIETGAVSSAEMIILAPTIEELGLLQVQSVKERLDKALSAADNQRAANIAKRMKSLEGTQKLEEAAEKVLQKQVAEVVKGLYVYFIIDISGSMTVSIPKAKEYIGQFLPGFPLDKVTVVVFSTSGRVVEIKHASKAGVEAAFRGITAGGGTDHAAGVRAATDHRKPGPDEDAFMIFVGDGGERMTERFVAEVRRSGVSPVAFGFLQLPGENYGAVSNTAAALGIPCLNIDERIFADPYAIPRTIRAMISATPVGKAVPTATATPRLTLVDTILKTPLLKRPAWAAAVPLTTSKDVVAAV